MSHHGDGRTFSPIVPSRDSAGPLERPQCRLHCDAHSDKIVVHERPLRAPTNTGT